MTHQLPGENHPEPRKTLANTPILHLHCIKAIRIPIRMLDGGFTFWFLQLYKNPQGMAPCRKVQHANKACHDANMGTYDWKETLLACSIRSSWGFVAGSIA